MTKAEPIKRYRIIITVNVAKLRSAVKAGKNSIEENIQKEFGWLEQSGIMLEEIQEDL